jgi:hypothetical protein
MATIGHGRTKVRAMPRARRKVSDEFTVFIDEPFRDVRDRGREETA